MTLKTILTSTAIVAAIGMAAPAYGHGANKDQSAAGHDHSANMSPSAASAQPSASTQAPGSASQDILANIDNPKEELKNARVIQQDGTQIGTVKDVNVSTNGKALGVVVAMADGQKTLDPASLRYDRDNRTLVSAN